MDVTLRRECLLCSTKLIYVGLGGRSWNSSILRREKYLKEVGVTAQQAIERMVREEKLAGKGKLKVKMVLTGEGAT